MSGEAQTMRILYQIPGHMTAGPLGAAEIDRRRRLLQDWSGPNTVVEVADSPGGPLSIESTAEEFTCVPPMLAALRQRRQPADAVIVGCFGDPGVAALREVLDCPVIGPFESALHTGAQLGARVGVVTILDSVVPMLDRLVLGMGLSLRYAGAVAIDVPISPWLYVCTMLLALLIGFSKRRQELISLANLAGFHRESLRGYTVPLLDQFINILAAATVIAYSVYTFDAAAVPRNHAMMLTIPFVIYAIFRYLLITQKGDLGGAPETLLVSDKPLLISLIGWGFTSALIIYLTK